MNYTVICVKMNCCTTKNRSHNRSLWEASIHWTVCIDLSLKNSSLHVHKDVGRQFVDMSSVLKQKALEISRATVWYTNVRKIYWYPVRVNGRRSSGCLRKTWHYQVNEILESMKQRVSTKKKLSTLKMTKQILIFSYPVLSVSGLDAFCP